MSTTNLPSPENWPWDFEKRRDNVGVWTMEQWEGYDQDALEMGAIFAQVAVEGIHVVAFYLYSLCLESVVAVDFFHI